MGVRDTPIRETIPSLFLSDGDLFGDDETPKEARRKVLPPPKTRATTQQKVTVVVEDEEPRRRPKPAPPAPDEVRGLTVGEFDYIHAFVCRNKHPYKRAVEAMERPVTCDVCGERMTSHFFSKRRKI